MNESQPFQIRSVLDPAVGILLHEDAVDRWNRAQQKHTELRARAHRTCWILEPEREEFEQEARNKAGQTPADLRAARAPWMAELGEPPTS